MFQAVELQSCLVLQMLLEANVYVSALWGLNYLLHIFIQVSLGPVRFSTTQRKFPLQMDELWSLDTAAILVAYVLAMGSETVRLYGAFVVNLRPEHASMWLLLTVTPCVLFPSMVYLRLSLAVDSLYLWPHYMSYAVLVLIGLEVIAILCHNIRLEMIETNQQLADFREHRRKEKQRRMPLVA
ncbi:Hypothetical predicted protein [Drosophila guanche]|uniref:Transmembrane protein 17B n=1 Tax=Drosophila guanche TaxID=7266 RepID=A0A3B0JBH9_DROGU|nr:Hypothetical predicted protein [Drosophila guanche]